MMQIPNQLWPIFKVIFVLSTIVTVTDCCSSRVLLLREHTLKIVEHQHNFHNHLHEHAHQLQQQIEQHVVDLVSQMELQRQLETQQSADVDGGGTEKTLLEWQDLGEGVITTTERLPEVTSESSWLNQETTEMATGEPPPEASTTPEPTTTTVDSSTAATTTTPKVLVQDDFNILRGVKTCSGSHKTDFCLNGGRCFRVPLANHSFFSCECADGFVGERCESKTMNELYVSTPGNRETQPKILMARIVFSFPMLILLSTVYVFFGALFIFRSVPEQRRSQQKLQLRKPRFFLGC